ncbi:hypothetical protein ACVWY0_003575 [Arthrobacter sp. UYNi723]
MASCRKIIMASNTERGRVKLPDGFDPSKQDKALVRKIAEVHGDGFEIDSLEEPVPHATRSYQTTVCKHAVAKA